MPSEPLEIVVPKDHELRIYVPLDEPLTNRSQGTGASIRLLGGGGERTTAQRAEVFGSAMVPMTRYFIQRGSTVVVFAWAEVRIELTGSEKLLSPLCWWVGTDGMHARPLVEYYSVLKDAMEGARGRRDAAVKLAEDAAAADKNKTNPEDDNPNAAPSASSNHPIPSFAGGPRVLICGKESSGKHTAMRTLANYAARQGFPPTLVDLSPATQTIGLPGTVASCVLEHPATASDANFDHLPSVAFMCGTMGAQALDTCSTFNTAGLISSGSAGMKASAATAATDAAGGSTITPAASSLRTIHGTVLHYSRLLANRVNERLGPSTTNAEGGYLPHAPTAIPPAHNTVAKSSAVLAGAIVVAPPVQGFDGAYFLAELIRAYGITHVLCIGDGQLLSILQHIMKDEEAVVHAARGIVTATNAAAAAASVGGGGGGGPTMAAFGLSTCVGIGVSDSSLLSGGLGGGGKAAGGGGILERPLSTFSGIRFDYLSPNPAILPRTSAFQEKLNELRCIFHFHGNGLVRYIPIRYKRSHDTMSVCQMSSRSGEEGSAANPAAASANPQLFVKHHNGKVMSLKYAKKDLTGLAGRLCAIVDLSSSSGAADGGGKLIQTSLTTAPVLCYAQLRTPDTLDCNMLVACPENVLDTIPHLAVVVGEFAYTTIYQE